MRQALIRYATTVLLLVVLAVLALWDVYAEVSGGEGTGVTISEITIHFLYLHPALAAMLGGLVGHLTWPQVAVPPVWRRVLQVGIGIVVLGGVDLLHLLPPVVPLLPFAWGVPIGHFIWPQRKSTEVKGFTPTKGTQ